MTTPVVIPSKAKAWTALLGSLLTAAVPLLLQISTSLPPPYPALVGGLVALATMFGVYHAPYAPSGSTAVLVPTPEPAPDSKPTAGGYTGGNPYRQH